MLMDVDANTSAIAAVKNNCAALADLVKKGEVEKRKEAEAQASKKRKREVEKLKKEEERKKKREAEKNGRR